MLPILNFKDQPPSHAFTNRKSLFIDPNNNHSYIFLLPEMGVSIMDLIGFSYNIGLMLAQ